MHIAQQPADICCRPGGLPEDGDKSGEDVPAGSGSGPGSLCLLHATDTQEMQSAELDDSLNMIKRERRGCQG